MAIELGAIQLPQINWPFGRRNSADSTFTASRPVANEARPAAIAEIDPSTYALTHTQSLFEQAYRELDLHGFDNLLNSEVFTNNLQLLSTDTRMLVDEQIELYKDKFRSLYRTNQSDPTIFRSRQETLSYNYDIPYQVLVHEREKQAKLEMSLQLFRQDLATLDDGVVVNNLTEASPSTAVITPEETTSIFTTPVAEEYIEETIEVASPRPLLDRVKCTARATTWETTRIDVLQGLCAVDFETEEYLSVYAQQLDRVIADLEIGRNSFDALEYLFEIATENVDLELFDLCLERLMPSINNFVSVSQMDIAQLVYDQYMSLVDSLSSEELTLREKLTAKFISQTDAINVEYLEFIIAPLLGKLEAEETAAMITKAVKVPGIEIAPDTDLRELKDKGIHMLKFIQHNNLFPYDYDTTIAVDDYNSEVLKAGLLYDELQQLVEIMVTSYKSTSWNVYAKEISWFINENLMRFGYQPLSNNHKFLWDKMRRDYIFFGDRNRIANGKHKFDENLYPWPNMIADVEISFAHTNPNTITSSQKKKGLIHYTTQFAKSLLPDPD